MEEQNKRGENRWKMTKYCNGLKDYELNAWLIMRLKSKPRNFAEKNFKSSTQNTSHLYLMMGFAFK